MIRFSFLLVLLASCARGVGDAERVLLSLTCSQSASKSLQAGAEAGVFLRLEGREAYSLSNHRFVSDGSGRLSGDPAAYYPDASQAATLYTYLPYQAGQTDLAQISFSVPTDQTASPREADLLWGSTSSTPTEGVVQLTLSHLFSKATVSVAGHTVAQTVLHHVQTEGALNVLTGAFASIAATSNVTGGAELIVPAQSVQSLTVTVDGVAYRCDLPAPIALEAGKSHTFNLTLGSNGTAELAAPVEVAEWTVDEYAALPSEAVSNRFTVYWQLPALGYETATKAVLDLAQGPGAAPKTAIATHFVVEETSVPLICTYSFDAAVPAGELGYAYRIEAVSFYDGADRLLQRCESVVGAWVYKTGAYTIGIEQKNLLAVVEGRVNSYQEVTGSGTIGGGVANQFALQLIEPPFAYVDAVEVRLTIDGTTYSFPPLIYTSRSNALLALTEPCPFLTARPNAYPYTVQKVELLDAGGSVVGTYDADVMVTRGGLVSLQLYQGKAVQLVSGATVSAIGTTGASTDAPVFTGTVTTSPMELLYAASSGATSVARVVVTVRTASGSSHEVEVRGLAMSGTPLAARTVALFDLTSGVGWPAGTKFPYRITHAALYDKEGNELVATTALTAPLEVRWSTKTTLSIMKF